MKTRAENRTQRSDKSQKKLEAQKLKQEKIQQKNKRRAELKLQRAAEHKAREELKQKQYAAREELRQKEYAAREEVRKAKARKRALFYNKIKSKLVNIPSGFDYKNHGLLPRVELEVEGDKTSVAARFSSAGITFSDMSSSCGKTRFKIRKKDLRKGIAILDEMCYNYRISATYGIGRRCSFLLARAGLIIGAALSIACLNLSYGYVWRVDISGNEKLSVAAISRALKEAGYASGCKKSAVDVDGVVASLGGVEGIADASCEVVGTTMYVRVLEATDHTSHSGYNRYTAKYDARVTRIVVRSGSAFVKRGDVVKVGDMLVSGDVYGTTGELLYTAECDAEVYGEVALTLTADVSETSIEYVRTGKVKKQTVFELFGFPLGSPKPPYASYETRAVTSNYDVLVPLYATTYEFYETVPTEVRREIDDIAREFAQKTVEEMQFTGDFTSSYTITPMAGGLYSVHLFLGGEMLISVGTNFVPEATID